MSAPGGRTKGSIHCPLPQAFGRPHIRSHQLQRRTQATSKCPPPVTEGIRPMDRPSNLKITKQSQFVVRRPDELLPANRGQSAQCASQYRSDHALEDTRDYAAFEMASTADYDAQSVVERELVLRLASLLWRLRRATAIEAGLFKQQAPQLLQFRQRRGPKIYLHHIRRGAVYLSRPDHVSSFRPGEVH
jgi:hypothetical protein